MLLPRGSVNNFGAACKLNREVRHKNNNQQADRNGKKQRRQFAVGGRAREFRTEIGARLVDVLFKLVAGPNHEHNGANKKQPGGEIKPPDKNMLGELQRVGGAKTRSHGADGDDDRIPAVLVAVFLLFQQLVVEVFPRLRATVGVCEYGLAHFLMMPFLLKI